MIPKELFIEPFTDYVNADRNEKVHIINKVKINILPYLEGIMTEDIVNELITKHNLLDVFDYLDNIFDPKLYEVLIKSLKEADINRITTEKFYYFGIIKMEITKIDILNHLTEFSERKIKHYKENDIEAKLINIMLNNFCENRKKSRDIIEFYKRDLIQSFPLWNDVIIICNKIILENINF
jgi:hypothetical protein